MISVPALLDEVLNVYTHKIEEKKVRLQKHFGSVEELWAFPGEVRQVFSNLLLNALEAVDESGTVVVRVRRCTGLHQQRGVRFTVADNGPGIAPEHLSRIFEAFFTTKDSKGTGLGLWVSHGIVHKQGGTIRVRSSVDQRRHGTCFQVFLPFEAVESTQTEEIAEIHPVIEQEVVSKEPLAASGTAKIA